MGVPKFYRWTSERYPCLSQVVREHQIPEFDNLYLDMNGIIHVCSHPNDDDPHFRISEAEIFKNIFHYIEILFRIIKPQRNFFMAVDGVAPRAKMNQQRGRRFRTAKEAEDSIKRALQKGEKLPEEERFDSNCITPGTEFMARLNTHLQYFVNNKVSSDPLWQKCNVYLSGHDVPGEGEHKIMDFIRYEKSRRNYDPNTRHCLYGLDADLLMLGLVTHEPHFSLLREEVKFGKQSKRVSKPEETVFHLLHLSLMREYLDFEFSALKEKLPFKYDLERIIDDWILLGFLVGNDFIPHLPNMHINHDALPFLYEVYKEALPKLDGYLHNGGFLNLPRFQKYLEALSKFDRDRFEDEYADKKWLEGRMGRSISPAKRKGNGNKGKKFSQLVAQVDDEIMMPVKNRYMALADVSDAFDDSADTSQSLTEFEIENDKKLEAMFGDLGFKDIDGGEELFEMEFKQHKRAYYIEKFEVPVADDEFVARIAFEYILAIQWNLHYYFNGIQSWSWYYPFHYSPYASDIINIESFDLQLEKSKPFKPFEQLLAVLPSFSRKLLPEAFQSLMIMDTSPIIDYYPTEFKTDLNGKQQEWEAVVLIPFIKERRLLAAMAPHYARLTDEEKERNSYGKCLKYRYAKNMNYVFPSTYPGEFKDIVACKASCEKIDMHKFQIDIEELKKGLCEGVRLDVYYPGFPTLKHIPHNTELKKAGVRVFSYASKSKNMVVNIDNAEDKIDVDTMRDIVGTVVHVQWPYMVEALVTAITDGERRFFLKQPENVVQEDNMTKSKVDDALFWMKNVRTGLLEKKGIDTGEVKVLVEAKTLKGKRYVCGSKGEISLQKEWADSHSFFAFQTILQGLAVSTPIQSKEAKSINELYEIGSRCFMMASPHYGCEGEVLEIDNEASRVRVSLSVPPEPDFEDIITNQTRLSDRYFPLDNVARKVGLSTKILAVITGNLFVARSATAIDSKVNLGLKLKFSGRNREVLGYARRNEDGGWSFSTNAVDVFRSYVQSFPEMFRRLSHLPDREVYMQEQLFPGQTWSDSVEEVLTFIKGLPCRNIDPVKCGSKVLDEKIVCAIEEAVDEAKSQRHLTKCVKVKVKPFVLFKPTAEFGNLVADPATDYYLFDRVVNVRDDGTVPMGYRGTIIGVHEISKDDKYNVSAPDLQYEVLFDEQFLGGVKLRSEKNKGAYMRSSSLLNLSYGTRKESIKKGFSPSRLTDLVEKAEPRPVTGTLSTSSSFGDYSPFSPQGQRNRSADSTPYRRPREATPNFGSRDSSTGGRSSERPYNRSGNYSKGDSDLKTPDYWLKGYGKETKEFSSASPYQYRESPKSSRVLKEPKDFKPNRSGNDGSFQDLWTKLQEPSRTPDKSHYTVLQKPTKDIENDAKRSFPAESRKINKEGTESLQKLLKIKLPGKQQPLQEGEDQEQQHLETASQRAKPSPNAPGTQANVLLSQLFKSSSVEPQIMNNPASPTSPLTPGSTPVPTKDLQNWCYQNKMPAPRYTYSVTPQGVHAVVNVGPAICFGGSMCRNKAEAAESAASITLGHLMHKQAQLAGLKDPVANRAYMYMGHRPAVNVTHSPTQQTSPWNSPLQFVGGPNVRIQRAPQVSPIKGQQRQSMSSQHAPVSLIQQLASTTHNVASSPQGSSPQWNSPMHVVGSPHLRMQQIPVTKQFVKGQHIPVHQTLLQQLQSPQQMHLHHAGVIRGHFAVPPGNKGHSPKQSNTYQESKETRRDTKVHEDEGATNTSNTNEAISKGKESKDTVDIFLPAFVPLQVNRAGMRANRSDADVGLKEAKTRPSGTVTKTSEDVDLINLEGEKAEDQNSSAIESQLRSQAKDNTKDDNAASSLGTYEGAGENNQAPYEETDSSLPKPRKDKSKKKKLLAPTFFAPKKQ